MGIGDFVADPRLAATLTATSEPTRPAGAVVLGPATPDALDLLKDFDALALALRAAILRESWANAFLFAAGLHQITEDWIRDPRSFSLIRRRLRRFGVAGRGASVVAGGFLRAAEATARTDARDIREWERDLARLVLRLAAAVAGGAPDQARIETESDLLLRAAERANRELCREVLRIPSCFRSFDVCPDDVDALVTRFAERRPERATPLAVVGIRTSGSYLAPLAAAFLGREGYADVTTLTTRPGELFDAGIPAALRGIAARGGTILVIDDPPNTGGSFAAIGRWLVGTGVPAGSIVPVAPLFTEHPPARLGLAEGIWQRWGDWSVHRRLEPGAVRETLVQLWGPRREVLDVEPLPAPAATAQRRHARGLFRVTVRDSDGLGERLVYAKGSGYGYFAEHALVVSDRMKGRVPEIFGIADGLIFREWLPEDRRADRLLGSDVLARAIAEYVGARERALAVPSDPTPRLFGRGTVWRRSAEILARAHGSASPLALAAAARVTKRLLQVDQPSIIDGTMDPSRWFVAGEPARVVKASFDHRAFSSGELYCYDAAFDLASAAASGDEAASDALRREHTRAGGAPISEERWLLYTLAHLGSVLSEQPDRVQETRRRMSLALQRYLSQTIFADTRAPDSGPLCAVDVDGVLETGELGFPALAPAAALALRALARHGWRSLVVTGRSSGEVRARCRAYPIAGGVAEYGAVWHDVRAGVTFEVLSTTERDATRAIRERAAELPGVHLDPAFDLVVRAYRLEDGRRRGLGEDQIAAILAVAPATAIVRGRSQTDLLPSGIDKAVGTRALATALRVSGSRPLAFAVGDSVSDLPMFELAERAYVPANAASLRAPRVRVARAPYAAGFARAVAVELGHAPGACATCAPPALSPDARLLFRTLAPQGLGRFAKLRATLGLLVDTLRG